MKALFLTAFFALIPNWTPTAEASSLIAGSGTAALQITIYGDMQCPFTARVIGYLDRLQADFGDRIGVSFSQYPLAFHAEARPAAIAVACAADEGKYAEVLKDLFAHQKDLGRPLYDAAATRAGIRDLDRFHACLDNPSTARAIDDEAKAASAIGVNSTPTLMIGKEVMKGAYPYDELKRKIEAALPK